MYTLHSAATDLRHIRFYWLHGSALSVHGTWPTLLPSCILAGRLAVHVYVRADIIRSDYVGEKNLICSASRSALCWRSSGQEIVWLNARPLGCQWHFMSRTVEWGNRWGNLCIFKWRYSISNRVKFYAAIFMRIIKQNMVNKARISIKRCLSVWGPYENRKF